jgi:hypothetical protein
MTYKTSICFIAALRCGPRTWALGFVAWLIKALSIDRHLAKAEQATCWRLPGLWVIDGDIHGIPSGILT